MIYLDNSATTKTLEKTADFIRNYYTEKYFNPSALYKGALQVNNDINSARKTLANILGCQNGEIIYTSGGSESNNTAIFGAIKNKKGRVITSLGEHLAIYNPFNWLKNKGYDVQFVKLKNNGQVDLDHYKALLNEDTIFVSIIHASNETGAINDIKNITQLAKEINPKCIVHSDGVQAFLKKDINVKSLNVDLYSISGHKVHCPKGIGALYVKKGVNINPLIIGASQEYGLRAGTENTALICAFSNTSKDLYDTLNHRINHIKSLRKSFLEIINNKIKDFIINSDENGLPNIISLSFAGIKSEILIQMMSDSGVYIGSGSACSSRQKVSRVLKEINVPKKYIDGSIRISFSHINNLEETEKAAYILCENVKNLRNLIR